MGTLLQRKWELLAHEEQRYYQEQFEKFEVKYQEQLSEFKKINQMLNQSKKIEKSIIKPKKPQIPQIHYVIQNRYKYKGKNYSQNQIYSELIQEFSIQRMELKEQLELEYESKQTLYDYEMIELLKQNCQKYQSLKEKLLMNLQQQAEEQEFNSIEYAQKNFAVGVNGHNQTIGSQQVSKFQSSNNLKRLSLIAVKLPLQEQNLQGKEGRNLN
ncbi:unnamed protein product (macronuclear) [Paramecium tetraurelia]|uniref:HMG box domain-containing protein n=1 Tax=Paramecium tetraurelia TaxID=5888 RepID=A0E790_PARTE|nr:uncharacterized protein GSPATT00023885001 [Paramecium tetraurelia]CAK91157.1 unnamed protein product [Paramecium tetraurelia]|eukprot:XP_001458554.1 hypothetical protein (macronuclear) [Paramecium tetraurelia strain d4-2]